MPRSDTTGTGRPERPGAVASPVDWQAACERVRFTPEGYRRPIRLHHARRIFRCSAAELDAIVAAGLPVTDGTVDVFDATNVALYSGSGATAPELHMQALRHVLRRGPAMWVSEGRWELVLMATCEGCRDPGAAWQVAPGAAGDDWQVQAPSDGCGPPLLRRTVRGAGRPGVVRSALARAVVEEVLATLRFQYAPEGLDRDEVLTRERGVASCLGASLVLRSALRARGFEVVLRSGILVGLARVSRHNWLEVVDDDGEVRHVDPSLALLADEFLVPGFRAFCIGGRFNRAVELPWGDDRPALLHTCAHPPVVGQDETAVRPIPTGRSARHPGRSDRPGTGGRDGGPDEQGGR